MNTRLIDFASCCEAMGTPRSVGDRALAAYQAAFEQLGMPASSRLHGPRHIGSKAELRALLREAGLPKAAAERIAAGGWPALSPDNAEVERTVKAVRSFVDKMKEL